MAKQQLEISIGRLPRPLFTQVASFQLLQAAIFFVWPSVLLRQMFPWKLGVELVGMFCHVTIS